MSTIHEQARNANARPVLRFDCFLDTTILSFPRARLPRDDWKAIVALYGVTPHHYSNRTKGYLLIGFQCPQPDLLRLLRRVGREHRGKTYRLDIGCDARYDEDLTVEEQFIWIKEHMLLKHRAAQRIEEIENADGTKGFYLCSHAHINGAPRDVCGYWGLEGKLDPLSKLYARFDVRLRGRHARQFEIDGLEFIDPCRAVLEHVRFIENDRKASERKIFSKIMRENDLAMARAQIALMKRHGQLEFAQRIHDHGVIRPRENNALVSLPNVLTWAAKRRTFKDNSISKEINLLGEGNAEWDDI